MPPASSSRTSTRPRVFLSYGWQDNLALVLRLKADLQGDGWEVWHDKDRIRGGDAFTAEIEDGIRWCHVMVAVMGPHSTRRAGDLDSKDRRDSICHRELSMADTVKGQGYTVPVMAVACTPPLYLAELDYVDMTDCPDAGEKYEKAYAKLLAALEVARKGEVRYRAWQANLRELDFRGVIREKTAGLYGRRWLHDEIDRWRIAGATQSLLILGDPGIGKSVIAAHLVADDPRVVGHFFCKHDEANTLEPGRLVQTLAAHLAANFPAYRARLDDPVVRERLDAADRDPVAALTQGVFGPLGEMNHPREEVRYLVIDALDEALDHASLLNIVRVLASSLTRMPAWLRLIATARNEADVTDRLRGLRFHPLDAGSSGNRDDIRDFIRSRLTIPGVKAHHVETLCIKSAGNFLYVVTTLGDLEAGHLSLDEIDQLSPGLAGRYLAFFERQFPGGDGFEEMGRLLDVMTAAVEPLCESQLAEATGIDAEEDLPRLRRNFQPFLKPNSAKDRDPVYAFYHKSLSDWLIDPSRRGGKFTARARKGHAALADWLQRRYRDGRAKWPAYLVRHLPGHLLACKRWDELVKVLRDPPYLESRAEAGDLGGLSADLASATGADGLPNEHPARPMLRLIEEAIRRELPFIARHPTTLFQCLWNSCWWYDCLDASLHYDPPKGGWDADGPPWQRAGDRLHEWMEAWRRDKERAGAFVWVRSLRPPAVPLGGALRAICTGHSFGITDVAFSPDGRVLASAASDATVRLWDRDSGEQLTSLQGHQDRVNALSWTADGCVLASGSSDNTVRLWDRNDGRELACLQGHQASVDTLEWSPDGRVLASGSDDTTVRLWDRESGRELACLLGHLNRVTTLEWSPEGSVLATGSDDHSVSLWDRDTGRELACLRGHQAPVYTLIWSPDGRVLASGSMDNTVRLWDRETGRELTCMEGHEFSVGTLDWSPDGQVLASGSMDNTVRLWDRESGREVACLLGHQAGVNTLEWSPEGRVLASGSEDHTVRLWDRASRCELACLRGHAGGVSALNWSLDGRVLASGSFWDRTIRLWDRDGERELACLLGHQAPVNTLTWSPDGRVLASGAKDTTVRLWNRDTGREVACFQGHKSWVTALDWSPDGQMLASGSSDNTVRVWERESGRELACILGHGRGNVDALVWSPDGQVLASATGTLLYLWDRQSGRELACLRGHTSLVNHLAWAANGRVLFSTGVHGDRAYWHAATKDRLTEEECDRLLENVEVLSPTSFDVFCNLDMDTSFHQPKSPTPIAYFPVGTFMNTTDGSTWAGSAGSEVYLLRLEGVQ